MGRTLGFILGFLSALVFPIPQEGTLVVRLVLSGGQIAAAKGSSDPTKVFPFRLAATADNRLIFSDHGNPDKDRKSTRLNSSHRTVSRMPSSA